VPVHDLVRRLQRLCHEANDWIKFQNEKMAGTHRARLALEAAGRDYPGAWQQAEKFRADRGPGFTWPDWCYLPLAGAYAIVSGGGPARLTLDSIGAVSRIGALAAWRMTQGIYRFDPAVFEAVIDTPITGDLPCTVLMQLPEWAVYIETPGLELSAGRLHGFWAHLEHDANTGGTELRLLLDLDVGLVPVPLHFGAWPLSEAVARTLDQASVHSLTMGLPLAAGDARRAWRSWSEPLVSLLLYLCSIPDIQGRGQPGNPTPVKTRRGGEKLFPADGPKKWDVGVRMGTALRAAYQSEQTQGHGEGSAPRGHVRRAHWHGFRSGPRLRADGSEIAATDRKFDLRWLPPIPVNLPDLADLPSTIKPVK
jgi:hypothetical protein